MRRLPFRGGLILIVLFCLPVITAACSAHTGLERPNGVAVAADSSLYIMDFGHYRIVQASEDGKLIQRTGKFGDAADQIYYGWDIALNSYGNQYIGHTIRDDDGTRHDGVKVFSPQGKFVREIGQADYERNSGVVPNLPYGVEVDSQDRVYTADYSTNTVRIFSPAGDLLAKLPGTGQAGYSFTNPGDVAVDDERGLLYITDFTMGRLLQFQMTFAVNGTPSITFLKSFGSYGREPGALAFPQNLAVDERTGAVYVGDMGNRRVQAFDPQGALLARYVPAGVADWQVLGLAVGPDGRVYAVDALNNVVWIFSGPDQPAKRVEVKP